MVALQLRQSTREAYQTMTMTWVIYDRTTEEKEEGEGL